MGWTKRDDSLKFKGGGSKNPDQPTNTWNLVSSLSGKIIIIIATRCHIMRLKCTEFDSRHPSVRLSVRLIDGVWHLLLCQHQTRFTRRQSSYEDVADSYAPISRWLIQKFRRRGEEGRRKTMCQPRRHLSRILYAFYTGKGGLLNTILSQYGGGRPHRSPLWIRHCDNRINDCDRGSLTTVAGGRK